MMHPAIERAWAWIWERFFCEETELFYDYLVSDRPDAAVFHLPSPEEIALQVPNACGWGTGMEDSMLSAGSMLDAVVARHAVTGEESMREAAAKIFRGMMRCAGAGTDGVSHYIESSRDQYTHWVYGAWRLYLSPLSDEAQREDIRRVLVGFAERAERNVREETGWDFLREDGGRTRCTKMWGELGAHEYLRLPMIYAAAWRITGDAHWKEMYLGLRAEAIEKTGGLKEKAWWRSYAALQLQYSLRLLYEVEEEDIFREKYRSMMRSIADLYRKDAPTAAEEIGSGRYDRSLLYYEYRPWSEVRPMYRGVLDGYALFNPAQSELPENEGFYKVRDVGETVSILALAPDMKVEDEQLRALIRVAEVIDYDRIGNYSPMLLACGYYLAMENRLKAGQKKT